ncbi:hypothetical protein J25TS5_37250 [Paenibacillus faecis]|uniref:hypothetical protein n=1 Tax=Paenibacillus faecis TaxID=862114 RepID=UPI001B15D189|nr:hypothetical protein [Paenibacillus faecis]GIO86793.1 hypothetical protein J25TS5_37250 [Paenibacillus faecis]
MFIRLFVNTNNIEEANVTLEKVTSVLKEKIKGKEIVKIIPYWKIEDVYVVEVNLDFYEGISDDDIYKKLQGITNKWTTFGNPVNELMASVDMDDCIINIDKIRMINIHL